MVAPPFAKSRLDASAQEVLVLVPRPKVVVMDGKTQMKDAMTATVFRVMVVPSFARLKWTAVALLIKMVSFRNANVGARDVAMYSQDQNHVTMEIPEVVMAAVQVAPLSQVAHASLLLGMFQCVTVLFHAVTAKKLPLRHVMMATECLVMDAQTTVLSNRDVCAPRIPLTPLCAAVVEIKL